MAGIRHIVPGIGVPADVVNLGYVVNVIEDPDERLATLQDAWHLAQEVLVVSARLETDRRSWFGPTLGDGTLTRLGTFQKYFAQDELSDWVNEATGQAPLAAAPGILYVFRDSARRETFAASQFRAQGRRLSIVASVDLYRNNRAALDALATFHCDRGRLPRADEFKEWDRLSDAFGSVRRASRFLRALVGPQRWDGVRRERSADLLVYLALARFRGRPRLSGLSEACNGTSDRCSLPISSPAPRRTPCCFVPAKPTRSIKAVGLAGRKAHADSSLLSTSPRYPCSHPTTDVRGLRTELPWCSGRWEHH